MHYSIIKITKNYRTYSTASKKIKSKIWHGLKHLGFVVTVDTDNLSKSVLNPEISLFTNVNSGEVLSSNKKKTNNNIR